MEEQQPSIQEQLEMQQQALSKIYKSVEKTRKYFLYSMIGTLVAFVLPLIIAALIIPQVISSFNDSYGGLF